jgi:hypothetical protein
MATYRTKPFLLKLEQEGVTGRNGGPISINTLIHLERHLRLSVRRLARNQSRIWTDEHLVEIKDYWLRESGPVVEPEAEPQGSLEQTTA